MYVPRNAPIKTPGTQDREIVFGREEEVLGADEKPSASVRGEKVGGRDGERSGDMDGTISGGNVNSKRVEAAQLAAESAYMQQRKTATKGLTRVARVTHQFFAALLWSP